MIAAMAQQQDDPPAGSLRETVAIARLIEAEQIKANKEVARQRLGLISRMRQMKAHGATEEALRDIEAEIKALPPSPSARDSAAAATGLRRGAYQSAREVIAAADRDPDRYGDLLPMLEERGAYVAHRVYRKRRGDTLKKKSTAYSANPLLHKSHRPQHNEMMDRAMRTLEGAVMGLRLVELPKLDRTRLAPWLAGISETAAYLHLLHKEMLGLYDTDDEE